MSEAISTYLTQVALHRGISFYVKIPNKLTVTTLQKSDEGKELHEVKNINELFEELDN